MTMENIEMATTKVKKAGRVNMITQIKLDFVDGKYIDAAAEELGLKLDGPIEARMVQLWGHFSENTPSVKQSICAQCNGLSDVDLEECPYCGSDVALDEEAEAVAKVALLAGSKAKPRIEVPTPKKESPPMNTTIEKSEKKMTNGIAKATRTEDDVDAVVREVQRLKSAGAVALWKLGHYLANEIQKTQVWKLRSEDGKPRYKTFDAFVLAELGMTPQGAYKLMGLSENFEEAQVRAFGTSKLSLLLEAPKDERPKIQKRMEDGELTTKRAVEKEVRKANRKIEGTPEAKERLARSGRRVGVSVGKQKTAEVKQITIAKILGSETIKAYKKPANPRSFDTKDLVRAKKFADQAWGVLELANEVKMYITLVANAAGEWSFKTTTVRNEDK